MGGITRRRSRTTLSALVVAMCVTGSGGVNAWAQMMTPVGPQWWPSRWGANDEAGASNWMTPEKVVEAVKLIRTGKVYSLGRVYEAGMPMRGQRSYKLTIPTIPTGGRFGTNKMIFNEELVTAALGQVGTQCDAW